MHKQFLQSLNRELIQAGVWGRPAEMLKQELYDHYQTEKESLLKQGKSENEATALAIEKLGSPHQLAQTAQLELDRRNGRFLPKLLLRFTTLFMTVCAFPLAWFILSVGLGRAVVFLFFEDHSNHLISNDHPMLIFFAWSIVWSQFFGPNLLAFLWLLRRSFNPIRGWNHLLLTSAYFALYYVYSNALISYVVSISDENPPGISSISSIFLCIFFNEPLSPSERLGFTWSLITGLSQCLLLLATPWLIRAWKIHQNDQSALVRSQ